MKMLLLTIYIWVVLHIISLDLSIPQAGQLTQAKHFLLSPIVLALNLTHIGQLPAHHFSTITCHVYFNPTSQLTISQQGYDPQLNTHNTWLDFLHVTLWHHWSQPPFSYNTSHLSLTTHSGKSLEILYANHLVLLILLMYYNYKENQW